MKKILSILITILALLSINTYAAELKGTAVPIETEFSDLTHLYEDYYKFSYKGEEYFFNKEDTIRPIKYNQAEFDFFIKEKGLTTYKKINDTVYAAVYYCAPYDKVFAGGDSWKGYQDFRLEFYDFDFNLINSIPSRYYIWQFDYINSKYYYSTVGGGLKEYESEDIINWKIGSIPNSEFKIHASDNIYIAKNYNTRELKENLSFDGNIFYEVMYENELGKTVMEPTKQPVFIREVWIEPYINYFLSIDGMNFINMNEIEELLNITDYSSVMRTYLTDNYFVIETKTQRITVPMSEINAELDKLKSVPYINLNGKLLAFEVPPTIQDDRTLVPMRFLFEQMDAEVEWDNDTQTATVYKNDDTIAFSIDDTEAEVNNTTKTMEVPARLINGKTMIPLRFLSEELGYTVEWNEELRMVTITE